MQGSRVVLAPSLSCQSLRPAVAGLIVVSFGIPLFFIVFLLVRKRQLSDSVRTKVCFGPLTGKHSLGFSYQFLCAAGYVDEYAWMVGIKLFFLHSVITTSMILPDALVRTKFTIMFVILLAAYTFHYLVTPFHHLSPTPPR